MSNEARDSIQFCPACFASEESGSWQHVVIKAGGCGHCMNCGNGSTVPLPQWAINSIREQASWVGKRYYPNREDMERYAEREALLSLVATFPGRTADPAPDFGPNRWAVSQRMPSGGSIQTHVVATDAESAMRSSGLTYYSSTQLGE